MTEGAVETAARVIVHPDAEALAHDVAARLLARVAVLQSSRASVSLVLTGGRTGVAVLEQMRSSPDRDTVDWSGVEVFWSDERFLPADHPERNERQAREALLDHVPVQGRRLHPVAASDGRFGDDAGAAADEHDALLRSRSIPGAALFDLCLLGVGEEGHVASIFPESAAARETGRLAVAVHGCPKPPPTRISLTLGAIRQADEVWLMTTGAGKAEAVAAALAPGASELAVPASGARGRTGTVWFLDTAASALLPV